MIQFLVAMCFALALIPNIAHATVRNAASCSYTDINTQITAAAASGDTINVPAGTCDFGGSTLISSKSFNLIGAGVDVTTITNTTSIFFFRDGPFNNGRISGFTLQQPTTQGTITIDGDAWRIDHIKFTTGLSAGTLTWGIFAQGVRCGQRPNGLIDHVTMTDAAIVAYAYPDTPSQCPSAWTEALGLGTANAVYVEDSTSNYFGEPDAIDCDYSGGYVIRYSTINNTSIDAHSIQGWNRACRKWEIYNNALNLSGVSYGYTIWMRGGTGAIIANTITGSYTTTNIVFDNVRSNTNARTDHPWFCIGAIIPGDTTADCSRVTPYYNTVGTTGNTYPAYCDAISPGNVSGWDNAGAGGYPCRDQIGRGDDQASWPTSGAQSPAPAQTLVPAMIIGNTANGSPSGITLANGTPSTTIQANRDYYLSRASFDGTTDSTTGAGEGPLASAPATCTDGTYYRATDQGSWNQIGSSWVVYKCTSNTWNAYYTPYTYPHPLNVADAAISNVSVIHGGKGMNGRMR